MRIAFASVASFFALVRSILRIIFFAASKSLFLKSD
nr:MAG TPA: hypothetical protein [Caudoviricetes sp.]